MSFPTGPWEIVPTPEASMSTEFKFIQSNKRKNEDILKLVFSQEAPTPHVGRPGPLFIGVCVCVCVCVCLRTSLARSEEGALCPTHPSTMGTRISGPQDLGRFITRTCWSGPACSLVHRKEEPNEEGAHLHSHHIPE